MGKEFTDITNVERAMQSLAGVVQGISLDHEISNAEIGVLSDWLAMYASLLHRQPFGELAELVERILADGVVTAEEREELLDWCQRFLASDSVAVRTTTNALRRLHGVLHGVAADGAVTHQEAADLGDWLEDYADVAHVWPFCELHALLARIRKDGQVDPEEIADLTAFCLPFVERAADGFGDLPVGHTLTGICDHGTDIVFDGAVFCFTGKAAKVRAELHDAVEARGGMAIDHVRSNLSYLVIGSLSQPAWAYASYGRKIEKVLELRRGGLPIVILHEHRLVDALGG